MNLLRIQFAFEPAMEQTLPTQNTPHITIDLPPVVLLGDPRLRKVADRVEDFNDPQYQRDASLLKGGLKRFRDAHGFGRYVTPSTSLVSKESDKANYFELFDLFKIRSNRLNYFNGAPPLQFLCAVSVLYLPHGNLLSNRFKTMG